MDLEKAGYPLKEAVILEDMLLRFVAISEMCSYATLDLLREALERHVEDVDAHHKAFLQAALDLAEHERNTL